MSQIFSVDLLPRFAQPRKLNGSLAVVIDLLRASTTITTALAAGAKSVLPCVDVDQARQVARNYPPQNVLLGGEREGLLIDGFDLDNSPAAYTQDVVSGKTIIFTSTNGTRAVKSAVAADRVLIGCFANLNSLLDLLIRDGRPVRLICAGTNGEITTEDVLCAGALATGLWSHHGQPEVEEDQTVLAMSLFESATKHAGKYLKILHNSRGGRNLRKIGLEADTLIASKWDTTAVVAEYSKSDRALHPAPDTRPDFPRQLQPPQSE